MAEQEKKKIFKRVKYKNISNSLIITFIIIFVVGNIIFFASPFYMSGVGELNYTPFSDVVVLENRDIRILNWAYSKSQHRMEIELQVDDRSFDGRNTYSFSAMFRPSNKAVKITKILEEPNYIVLHIDGIPKSFREISLRMEVEQNPIEQIRLYSNAEQITFSESIEPISQLEYHIRRIERNIASYNNNITALNTEIKAQKNKIENIKATNLRLEESKQYQTTAEIEITNKNIKENLNAMADVEKTISEMELQRQEQQNLIAQSNERLKELKK